MSDTIISVENLSKSYRLGQIGTGTFAHDLNVWWARTRGNPNPLLRIGETDQDKRDRKVADINGPKGNRAINNT
ncbi:MAG: hypothetical protein FVQ83_08565 [Chloroflexi bacterium]|nr:hypothetical protein [Chloroflexota bacterium]